MFRLIEKNGIITNIKEDNLTALVKAINFVLEKKGDNVEAGLKLIKKIEVTGNAKKVVMINNNRWEYFRGIPLEYK
jgi:hypothetical protein